MNQQKKPFTILGYSIWRLLAYFILYSVAGYIIETIFGIMTKGMWESRQSFLYGPFCAIYGLGAVIMIVFLQYFTKSNTTLFLGGFLIGSITEYLVSLIGELLFRHKMVGLFQHAPQHTRQNMRLFFPILGLPSHIPNGIHTTQNEQTHKPHNPKNQKHEMAQNCNRHPHPTPSTRFWHHMLRPKNVLCKNDSTKQHPSSKQRPSHRLLPSNIRQRNNRQHHTQILGRPQNDTHLPKPKSTRHKRQHDILR